MVPLQCFVAGEANIVTNHCKYPPALGLDNAQRSSGVLGLAGSMTAARERRHCRRNPLLSKLLGSMGG